MWNECREAFSAQTGASFGEPATLLMAAKVVGALAGSLISVAYILPRTRREALLRWSVGFVTGLVFGGTVGVKIAESLDLLHKVSPVEIALMGAAIASLSAWWALGAVQRFTERWPGLPLKNVQTPLKTTNKEDSQT